VDGNWISLREPLPRKKISVGINATCQAIHHLILIATMTSLLIDNDGGG